MQHLKETARWNFFSKDLCKCISRFLVEISLQVGSVHYYLGLWSRSVLGYYVEGTRTGFRGIVIWHLQDSVVLVIVIDWLTQAPMEVAYF